MFIAIEIPGSVVILSETIYPAIVTFLRYEFVSFRILGLPINAISVFVLTWIVGTVWLTVKYIDEYVGKFKPLIKWIGTYPRDEYAESLLSEIIGADKNFRVYRNACFKSAGATALKPYIILPEVDFSQDELRVVLLHEWKHIQDKDYLTGAVVDFISFLFWWNPMVYVLRKNFEFAKELKCDQFAVSNEKDFDHFLDGLRLMKKSDNRVKNEPINTFISDGDGIIDRLKVLALRSEVPRGRRMLVNVFYSIVILALFLASYAFTILPVYWTPADESLADDFMGEYSEVGEIFSAGEVYLIDNEDSTYSFYVDGQFVRDIDETHDIFNALPIRTREND
jgi:hypothetical protein